MFLKKNLDIRDDQLKHYIEIYFLRCVIGDLYNGEHHDIIANSKIYDIVINKFWEKIDSIWWNILSDIARDNNMSPDELNEDESMYLLEKEIYIKVKQYYKKIATRY